MRKPDGGPAFPCEGRVDQGGASRGLTKREWFAGLAMQAYITVHEKLGDANGNEMVAWSWEMADKMLAAGSKE